MKKKQIKRRMEGTCARARRGTNTETRKENNKNEKKQKKTRRTNTEYHILPVFSDTAVIRIYHCAYRAHG